MIMAWW